MTGPVADFLTRYRALGLSGTGTTSDEVDDLERQLGVTLPAAYRAFHLILGRDGGQDFIGSDCTVGSVPALREPAAALLRSSGSEFRLPTSDVVFLMHQGYSFAYFVADGGQDDPQSCSTTRVTASR